MTQLGATKVAEPELLRRVAFRTSASARARRCSVWESPMRQASHQLTVATEGDYLLNLGVGQGLGSLSVDGVQVAGGFALSSQLSHLRAVVHLTAREHAVTIGAYGIPGFLSGPLQVRLSWVTPEAAEAALAAAVEQVRAAAVAVVFAYDDGTEGVDRPDLALPFGQDALVSAVAAANPDTVVVLARERVEHQIAVAVRRAGAVDPLELGAARQAPAPRPWGGGAALAHGQTVRRLRPLSRRRLSVSRPARVPASAS